jgi:hypothetical protein
VETDPDDIDLHMSVDDFKDVGKGLIHSLAYYESEQFLTELEAEASQLLVANIRANELHSSSILNLNINSIKLDN